MTHPYPFSREDRPTTIAVVGCGFLGSVFMTEWAKRSYAARFDYHHKLIDFDTVEERNTANQNFDFLDVGKAKALAVTETVSRYNRSVQAIQEKVTLENISDVIGQVELIVDCVDNLETRQLLWAYAMQTGIPVLHLGLSEQGTGKIEWSHPTHDIFSLSPPRTAGKTIVDPPSGVNPPCELARMRLSGLLVGFIGAATAACFFGFDAESYLKGDKTPGWMISWVTNPTGVTPTEELWKAPPIDVPMVETVEAEEAIV